MYSNIITTSTLVLLAVYIIANKKPKVKVKRKYKKRKAPVVVKKKKWSKQAKSRLRRSKALKSVWDKYTPEEREARCKKTREALRRSWAIKRLKKRQQANGFGGA
jgi:hypothetical protein